MEVGQYIGKFLLKHKYCSLPGLGVFDLKKTAAKINSSNSEVSAPKYEVTFVPVGSIDDMFASFIANFENVSISNASNNIKEYCIMVKEEVAKTGKYEIENLGRLTIANNKLSFQQSPDLDLGLEPVPVQQIEIKPISNVDENGNPKKDDFSYPPSNPGYRNSNTNWMKMLMPALAIVGLGVAAFLGYQFMKGSDSKEPTEEVVAEVQKDTLQNAIQPTETTIAEPTATTPNDTAAATPATAATPAAQPVNNGTMFQVVLFTYDNETSATLKSNKLTGYGNKTSVVNRDGKFLVVVSAAHPLNDTLKLSDSLRKMFNPKGDVHILK